MFNIDWPITIKDATRIIWRKPVRIDWLLLLTAKIRSNYAAFLIYRQEVIYKVGFNSQIIYLEKLLNDKFSPITGGIYINNIIDIDRLYVYNKIEEKPKLYVYNKWKAATVYAVGEFAVYGDSVWRCLTAGSGQVPVEGANWTFHKKKLYMKNKAQYLLSYDFIVMVPAALVFDINEMKAQVNFYKLAGKRYTIQTY